MSRFILSYFILNYVQISENVASFTFYTGDLYGFRLIIDQDQK